ncbi:P-loop containing nucleoside triphosphate hydrolase protein [Xylariomycetidae sp. FL2044]|nr:P-loop containing nucleoside triphosphate hydrolase protein [Xylariomycetidae sp. FL2044]
MYRFEKTFGILLADGMGVGKTLEGSCGIVLAYHIRLAAQEVRRDRRTGTGRHLVAGTPDNAQSPGCECPSGTYLRGFACPCVDRLPTAQLIKSGTLPRGPAVILVPPGLRKQWYEQLCKYVSPVPLSGGGRQTEIWSIHTAADKVSNAVRGKHRGVRFVTAGELRSDDITDSHWEWEPNATAGHRPFLRFTGRSQRDNSHIIMILPASPALTGIQRESTVKVECEGGTLEEPFFIKPGWVVIDEAHNHITRNTVLWQFIKKLVNRSGSPLYLISMSGTPIRRSPSALLPFFDAVTSTSVRRWGKPPSYLPLEDFDRWVKESGWLVDRRGYVDSDDTAKRSEYEKRFQECKKLGAKVLSPYIIQRHSHYSFFGYVVIPLPPMHVESVAFSVFPAAYLADIRLLVNLSKEQLDKRLENKIISWSASSHGARPTMESIISEMDRGFGTQGRFYDLGLCATFPGLARMLLHGQPCRFRVDDLRSNLNTMSDADLRRHKLWPYLDAIRSGSSKMDFIHKKVQDMLRDDERHKDVDDNRPTLRKKMIIFTLSPTTAFLVAILLRKELPRVRQTLVLATDAPAKRGTLYAPFCRLTDEETPEDKDPDDPLLLITTARIAGEGLNLTRASYVILMEPAFAKQVEEQAFRRVHRYGQQATTHLFTLHSSWNPAEMIVKSRQDARSKLLQDESIWTVRDMPLE